MSSNPFSLTVMMNKIVAKPENFSFCPSRLIRNHHVQSILASSRLRILGDNNLMENSEEIIVTAAGGSRLLSFFTRKTAARGLIIIIHGWEGSSSSTYVLAAGNYFYNSGFSVCRLNLRDHGNSHHLNEGLFHGALIEETFDAISQLSGLSGNLPVYIVGFSLGANFCLRIAAKHTQSAIQNLRHVFAISPPLNPYKTTLAIDNGYSFYRLYFLRKWKKSLLKKQQLFPMKYDFGKILQARTCLEMTEAIMPYFPDFPSSRDYFNLYTLRNDFFQDFEVPVTVFIAEDDPVIPPDDFGKLQENEFFRVSRQKFGGHCGFLDLFPFRCWHLEKIVAMLY
jgi:predicted alpha/beta-fold hydrolase